MLTRDSISALTSYVWTRFFFILASQMYLRPVAKMLMAASSMTMSTSSNTSSRSALSGVSEGIRCWVHPREARPAVLDAGHGSSSGTMILASLSRGLEVPL